MKNTALILAITATLCTLTSCVKEETFNIDSNPIILTEDSANAAVKADTTDIAVVTETKTESTTAADITSEKADNTEDFTGLSGYWYADGDPKAAFFHIDKEGKFTEYYSYYGAGIVCRGNVKRELAPGTDNYIYCIYRDSGELYKTFADDGEKEKTDIYTDNDEINHYVKLYGEDGTGDDGRNAEDIFSGSWICGRAILEISYKGDGEFRAQVTWSSSATAHSIWVYPLTLDNGKLVCNGKGTLCHTELENADSEPNETVEFTNGSAEFSMKGNHLFWNDLNKHCADDMLFEK